MPLPQGWVKINVDVEVFVTKNHAVLGFIIRNEEGFIMGSGFKCNTPNSYPSPKQGYRVLPIHTKHLQINRNITIHFLRSYIYNDLYLGP